MWKFHRIWCVARVYGSLPILGHNAKLVRVLPVCPFCSQQAAGLFHLIAECPSTEDLRRRIKTEPKPAGAFLAWALGAASPTEATAVMKFEVVGISVARAAQAVALEIV